MKKADVLEFAILGVLQESPVHGYELRKRMAQTLGTLQSISFGSLYPALQMLVNAGSITGEEAEPTPRQAARAAATDSPAHTRRNRIAYTITESGRLRFASLLADAGPNAWDDEGFRVHFAFFARADRSTRTTILEGRRMRLAERSALMREHLTRARERVDAYTLELQRHGLDEVEREMRWLDDLIAAEHQHIK